MACPELAQDSTMNGHGAPPCVRSVLGLPALLTITLPRNPSWPGRHRRMLRLLPDAQPEGRKRTCDRPDVVLSCSSSPTPSKRWMTVSLDRKSTRLNSSH